MSTTYKLTPHEAVTVISSDPEALVVEASYDAGGSAPPPHLHPAQDEQFVVLEGELNVKIDGEPRVLGQGEELSVPRGIAHQMWNGGQATARVRWTTSPRGRTEEWFTKLDALQRSGRVGSNGMPGPLAFAAYLTEYSDVFQLAAGPRRVVSATLAALAPLGRARGYR